MTLDIIAISSAQPIKFNITVRTKFIAGNTFVGQIILELGVTTNRIARSGV